jgi:FKBP-type peptidyl-prolyl cis-trans isomerase (trigger factor)
VGQKRRREAEKRLRFLLLQLEIARENGYEFQQQRIERLIRRVEAELGGEAELGPQSGEEWEPPAF